MKPTILFLDEPIGSIKTKFLNLCNETDNISDATVIYTHMTHVPSQLTNLECIICPCTGIEHLDNHDKVDIIYLDDKQFLKENVHSTSEYTILSILHSLRMNKDELWNTRVGLIGGAGRIGQQLIDKLYGMTNYPIMVFDNKDVPKEYIGKCIKAPSCSEIYNYSDLVSIHLTGDGNKGFINGWHIGAMIDNNVKYLINSARSYIIEPEPLISNISKFKMVCLDLTGDYPDSIIRRLINLSDWSIDKHLHVTKHAAGSMTPSRIKTDSYVYNKFEKWVDDIHKFLIEDIITVFFKALVGDPDV